MVVYKILYIVLFLFCVVLFQVSDFNGLAGNRQPTFSLSDFDTILYETGESILPFLCRISDIWDLKSKVSPVSNLSYYPRKCNQLHDV